MTKKMILLMMVLVLLVFAAEEVLGAEATGAEAFGADLSAAEMQNPLAALKVSMPDAQVHYAVKEYEDGREEWKLFFEQNGALGVCKIFADSNTIRKVEMYDRGLENALTAEKAMQKLAQEKGELTIIELDLDWDDGCLMYEGEAELNGKRYEFEMTAEGRIIEWERD